MLVLFIVFVFKQKTAYEMRISDWSSDVCSSDLLLVFWQKVNPDTGALLHDFRDATLNTRFLGDLYQDLSEAARKRYALLQTPEFVEEFILERTLDPAIRTFGQIGRAHV